MKKNSLLIASLILSVLQSNAITFKENLLFTAKIEGNQVVPSVSTNAQGIASFMLNKTRDSISVNITFAWLSGTATSIIIYQGEEGTNGTTLIDLSPSLIGNRLSTYITGLDVSSNLSKFFNDNLYLQVTTSANPSGEIRGQIRLESDWNFVSDLNGMEAIPMVTGNAYGLGSFGLSLDQKKVDFKIICQELTGSITGAKLYNGAFGEVGVEVADLTSYINGNVIIGNIVPTQSMLEALFVGNIYFNVTTGANPTGELRSQLVHYNGISFDALTNGDQMVPEVSTPAQALCVIRLSPGLDTLYYDAVIDNINSSIDYAHLHVGNFGVAYTTLQVDFTASIDGNRLRGIKTGSALSTSTKNKLLISNLSLIVHSGDYPNGEIRGQVVRYARKGFTVNMDGEQVVPSVATAAYGSGIVSIDRNDENAHYLWISGNLSSTATAAHFHSNLIGQNGVQIYDITSSMNADGNDVSADGFWKNDDVNPFLFSNSNQFNSDSVYLDIENNIYPEGEIRGQVLDGTLFYTTTSIDDDQFLSNVEVVVIPNPFQDYLNITLKNINVKNLSVKIYDVLGNIVFNNYFYDSSSSLPLSIDASKLISGVYYLSIISDEKSISSKIFKN